jgi:uncharacterized paraquat-inducible protein A
MIHPIAEAEHHVTGGRAAKARAGFRFTMRPVCVLWRCLMLILHPRIGGIATATIIANTMWGLVGFGEALLALHLAVVALGAPVALAVALAVSVAVNIVIFAVRRRGHAAYRSTCRTDTAR